MASGGSRLGVLLMCQSQLAVIVNKIGIETPATTFADGGIMQSSPGL
jgi:hypothetical protein